MPAPVIDQEPPPPDKVFVYVVVPECEYVCNSLLVLPSTSVAVSVICPPFVLVVSLIVRMPAAFTVTPAAPAVFEVMSDDVAPPAPTPNVPSLLTLPSTSVKVFAMVIVLVARVRSMPAPSARVTAPPPPERSSVYEVGPAPPAVKTCAAPVSSAAGAQVVPFHFNTCPDVALC